VKMGRPEFENQTLISAVTNKSVVTIAGKTNAVTTPGVYERITVLSPKNTISKLYNIMLSWDIETTPTSGTKSCIIDQQYGKTSPEGQTQGIGLFKFTGDWNKKIMWDQGEWQNVTTKTPNDLGAMVSQIQAGRFDEFNGIQIVFSNSFNFGGNAYREWILFCEREVVAR